MTVIHSCRDLASKPNLKMVNFFASNPWYLQRSFGDYLYNLICWPVGGVGVGAENIHLDDGSHIPIICLSAECNGGTGMVPCRNIAMWGQCTVQSSSSSTLLSRHRDLTQWTSPCSWCSEILESGPVSERTADNKSDRNTGTVTGVKYFFRPQVSLRSDL